MEFVKELSNKGISIIMVTHDMQLTLEYCNRAIVLSDGKNKKRTWYSYKKLTKMDFAFIIGCILLLIGAIYLRDNVISGFYYPF